MASFAFINVDSNTSLSDAEENLRKIRSHVTRRVYEEQRQKAKIRQKRPRSTILPRAHAALVPGSDIDAVCNADDNSDSDRVLSKSKRKSHRSSRLPQMIVTIPFGINPSRADPFAALPISIRPDRLDRTLWAFRIPRFRTALMNFAPHSGVNLWGKLAGMETAWSDDAMFNEDDPLVLMERLHSASFLYDQLRSAADSEDTLWYRTEGLRLVRKRITSRDMPNELIVTIMLMGVFAATEGDVVSANSHNEASWRCINMRGGFASFPLILRRIFAWADTLTRVCVGKQIEWDWHLTIDPWCDGLPPDLAASAFTCEQMTAQSLPRSLNFTLGILFNLHVLALSSSIGWSHYQYHPAVSNVFFQLLYQTQEFCAIEPKHRDDIDPDTFLMFRSLVVTSRFFSRATIAPVFDNPFTTGYMERLRTLLQSGKGGLRLWERNGALEFLLWLLAVNICAAPPGQSDVMDWFNSTILWVTQKLKITTEAEFESTVKSYPWTTKLSFVACKDAWKEAAGCDDAALETEAATSAEGQI